ncbi:MAG TPA: O-antigen ligase family protein [Thermoleophilaceae bacterium]|nr:O-antigen ligase family protein [Thermoleophilaceae bacterium]
MGAPLALAQAIEGLGVVAAAVAVAGKFVLPSPRGRAAAALLALALMPLLVVSELWDSEQIRHFRDHPGQAVGAAFATAVVVGALAVIIRHRAWLLPLMTVAALPVRIPLESGGATANLLLPLYAVAAGGVVAYAWERIRPAGDDAWVERRAGPVELALSAFVVLYALQSLYSSDFEQALKNVAFFYVPFALVLKLLVSVRWSRRLVLQCFLLAVGLAVVFVGIGFWEYATRQLFWNRKVIESNQFESYFRVNSLFFDPNIYGRFLAIVMVGLASTLLWARRQRDVLLTAALLALLWGGLVLTFSQSSFAALLVGLAALAALRWNPFRHRLLLVLAAAAVVAGAVLFADDLDITSKNAVHRSSSGRFKLVSGGLDMFADRPVWGFGAGSFAERYRERERVGSPQAATASHTTPVTVAAEQGIVGLAAYLLVVGTGLRLLFSGLGPLRGRDPPPRLVTRAFVAAGFVALVTHTLLYASFLEDPIAWTLIGLGIVLAGPEPLRGPPEPPGAEPGA